ncbi:hypothetical protein KBI51_09720 [Aerococcaceae bacterium zg-ZUI334]|uniref:hypothetical protein n=1 Tax=Aerococcaceae bacterium zg-252 TaxID=2796928 RepID=UPI001B93BF96|nr:hypothetical protein [Aerococcaceae bacterium zg-ZUI334]
MQELIYVKVNFEKEMGPERYTLIFNDGSQHYSCYSEMILVMQEAIENLVNDGIIDAAQAWQMRLDYNTFNDIMEVESYYTNEKAV